MIIVLMIIIIIRTMTGFIAIISFYLNFFQILNRRFTKKNREGLKYLTKSVLYMYLPEENDLEMWCLS